MKKIITTDYVKSFKPCKDRLDNYLAFYKKKKFTLIEFLELENITWQDKKWLMFHEKQELLSDELLREFALICACRAVENCDSQEVKYYYDLVLNIYISDSQDQLKSTSDFSVADSVADSAAYYAAYPVANSAAYPVAYYAAYRAATSAAYRAADRAVEENVQKEILINLIESITKEEK